MFQGMIFYFCWHGLRWFLMEGQVPKFAERSKGSIQNPLSAETLSKQSVSVALRQGDRPGFTHFGGSAGHFPPLHPKNGGCLSGAEAQCQLLTGRVGWTLGGTGLIFCDTFWYMI